MEPLKRSEGSIPSSSLMEEIQKESHSVGMRVTQLLQVAQILKNALSQAKKTDSPIFDASDARDILQQAHVALPENGKVSVPFLDEALKKVEAECQAAQERRDILIQRIDQRSSPSLEAFPDDMIRSLTLLNSSE